MSSEVGSGGGGGSYSVPVRVSCSPHLLQEKALWDGPVVLSIESSGREHRSEHQGYQRPGGRAATLLQGAVQKAPCSKNRANSSFLPQSLPPCAVMFFICFLMSSSLGHWGYLWGECNLTDTQAPLQLSAQPKLPLPVLRPLPNPSSREGGSRGMGSRWLGAHSARWGGGRR